jgi:hypothetical protein
MQFSFEVGDNEKVRIEFSRDPFFGTMKVTANGEVVAARSPSNVSTHFSFTFVNRYAFTVGERERHDVVVEHSRPKLFGGLRPQTYRVYVDGALVAEHAGY